MRTIYTVIKIIVLASILIALLFINSAELINSIIIILAIYGAILLSIILYGSYLNKKQK